MEMATDLVISATSEKSTEVVWASSIEICELISRDPRQGKFVIRAIKKRVGNKNSNTQISSVMLLEILMNNLGDHIYGIVNDIGLLPELVMIAKTTSNSTLQKKIYSLLDATQTSLGGASGKFPSFYSAYISLVDAGIQFPRISKDVPPHQPISKNGSDNRITSNYGKDHSSKDRTQPKKIFQDDLEYSIIQKSCNSLDVLREVLDAVEGQDPEAAKNEFTLDLVEQCSFRKQQVMKLVLKSKNEMVVSRAIELNEALQTVLVRHDSLLSPPVVAAAVAAAASPATSSGSKREEAGAGGGEDIVEQLIRRRKGKACANVGSKSDGALNVDKIDLHEPPSSSSSSARPFSIPPPPSNRLERERYFRENGFAGRRRGLSLSRHHTNLS